MNQFEILMTAAAVRNGQPDIPYKGEHQTLTKQSMSHQVFFLVRLPYIVEHQTLTTQSMSHQVCPGETYHATISESTMTMLMSRGRSNLELHFKGDIIKYGKGGGVKIIEI